MVQSPDEKTYVEISFIEKLKALRTILDQHGIVFL